MTRWWHNSCTTVVLRIYFLKMFIKWKQNYVGWWFGPPKRNRGPVLCPWITLGFSVKSPKRTNWDEIVPASPFFSDPEKFRAVNVSGGRTRQTEGCRTQRSLVESRSPHERLHRLCLKIHLSAHLTVPPNVLQWPQCSPLCWVAAGFWRSWSFSSFLF